MWQMHRGHKLLMFNKGNRAIFLCMVKLPADYHLFSERMADHSVQLHLSE
jgi:hypothetical protein